MLINCKLLMVLLLHCEIFWLGSVEHLNSSHNPLIQKPFLQLVQSKCKAVSSALMGSAAMSNALCMLRLWSCTRGKKMAVLVFLSSQSHTRWSESEHSRWMSSSQKGAFVPHLQSLTVAVKLSLPSTYQHQHHWGSLQEKHPCMQAKVTQGDSWIRIYFVPSLKWPHWWPTTASHKEKLEAARDTNRNQFSTESFTVTTIYPCLKYSYKKLKRNISIHYKSLLPFL